MIYKASLILKVTEVGGKYMSSEIVQLLITNHPQKSKTWNTKQIGKIVTGRLVPKYFTKKKRGQNRQYEFTRVK